MSDIKQYTKGSKNIKHLISTIKYKAKFARDNPDYFYPAGIWVFCGAQGAGKTLSAVKCLKAMLKDYPKAKICSNLDIKGLDRPIIPFTDYSQLSDLTNGIEGIIFFLDEIHVLWNSLESKDIPITEMACFCQMRKDRRVIIGTCQVYNRIAKPIREQLQYIIDCRCFASVMQFNKVLNPANVIEENGHIDAECLKNQIWFHSPDLYESYDTLFKIKKAEHAHMACTFAGSPYGRPPQPAKVSSN